MSISSRVGQYGEIFNNWMIEKQVGSGSNGKTEVFQLKRVDSNWEEVNVLKVVTIIEENGKIDLLPETYRKSYEEKRKELSKKAEEEVHLMYELRDSPYIVNSFDYKFLDWKEENQFGRDLLIRMEFLDTLDDLIKSEMHYDEQQIIQIGKDICKALIHCHKKSIIHRDIKLANIFKNREGTYKLGDFGIARMLENSNVATTMTGTWAYAAPEQFAQNAEQKYDYRMDIYSLGLVLYELSNQNRLPFASSRYISKEEIQLRITGKQIPMPSNVSQAFGKVILKACSYQAKDRYQSAQEFLDDLRIVEKGINEQIPSQIIEEKDIEDPYATHRAVPQNQEEVNFHVVKTNCVVEKENISQMKSKEWEQEKEGILYQNNLATSIPPELPKPGLNPKKFILSSIGIISSIIIIIWIVSNNGQIYMPEIYGKEQTEAIELLETEGFVVEVEEIFSDIVSAGNIIKTSIKTGAKCDKGTTVTIYVSKGNDSNEEKKYKVENFVGKMLEEVRDDLEERGIYLDDSQKVYSDTELEGVILSQDIQEGTELEAGSTIVVTVSLGKQMICIPKLTLLDKITAEETLHKLLSEQGLPEDALIITWIEDYHPTIEEGVIITQSIEPEVKVEKGTEITLQVSRGPEAIHEHNYNLDVSVIKEATCTSEGEKKNICSCGDIWIETIPKTEHSIVKDIGVAATCVVDGKTEGSHCSVCKMVIVEQKNIPATGHKEVIVAGKNATCTTTGLKEGKQCSVCGEVTKSQEMIPATGHKEVIVAGKVATCTTTGLTEGKQCSVCGEVTLSQTTIAIKGHIYDNDSDAYCNNCNEYRATWHYYDQWNNNIYEDWELYKTETKESTKTESITTYTYRSYYWVDSTGDFRETGPSLIPSSYLFNKYLFGNEASKYGGVTTGTDTYITKVSNKKYNIKESGVYYYPQGFVSGKGCIVDGIQYWEEIIGSEEKNVPYTEYHYFFRKYY